MELSQDTQPAPTPTSTAKPVSNNISIERKPTELSISIPPPIGIANGNGFGQTNRPKSFGRPPLAKPQITKRYLPAYAPMKHTNSNTNSNAMPPPISIQKRVLKPINPIVCRNPPLNPTTSNNTNTNISNNENDNTTTPTTAMNQNPIQFKSITTTTHTTESPTAITTTSNNPHITNKPSTHTHTLNLEEELEKLEEKRVYIKNINNTQLIKIEKQICIANTRYNTLERKWKQQYTKSSTMYNK